MSGPPPPRPGGGLSLYADLLDPPGDSSASISRAPQVSQRALDAVKEQEAAAAAKKADAALRFNPIQNIRRPQQKTQKPKPTFPKAAPAAATGNNAPGGNTSTAGAGAAPAPVKSTLADWTNTEDDDWMYAGEKRPRGNKNKKKKKNNNASVETDWNEIYDPSRPTNVDEYLRSDERIREVREWKALLYRHRKPAERKRQSSWDSEEEEDDRPVGSMLTSRTPSPVEIYADRGVLVQTNSLLRLPTPSHHRLCHPHALHRHPYQTIPQATTHMLAGWPCHKAYLRRRRRRRLLLPWHPSQAMSSPQCQCPRRLLLHLQNRIPQPYLVLPSGIPNLRHHLSRPTRTPWTRTPRSHKPRTKTLRGQLVPVRKALLPVSCPNTDGRKARDWAQRGPVC